MNILERAKPGAMTGLLRLVFLLGLVAVAPARAQEAPPLYDVELIVFEQINGPGDEARPLAESRPPVTDAWNPAEAAGLAPTLPASAEAARSLPESAFRLDTQAARLARGRAYRVLLHTAWRQPGLPREEAFQVRLRAGDEMGARLEAAAKNTADNYWTVRESMWIPDTPVFELDGTVTISLSRYLHAHFDLALTEVGTDETEDMGSIPQLISHRLKQHRRMRSERLHYIDHPRLGVLIEIFPVEDEAQS